MRPWPRLLPALLLALAADSFAADPIKVGPEIVASLPPGEYPEVPRVAADPAGNFMVVWEYDYAIRAQALYATGNVRGPAFTVSGPDHSASEGGYDAEPLSVAADGAGNFVVAFNSYDTGATNGCESYYGCLFTRRFDVNGKLAPAIFEVANPLQNVYPPYDSNPTQHPEIASDGDGNFVVVWEGYDGSVEGVFGRKLVGSGQLNGGVFRINDDTDEYQGDYGQLDVSADAASNFTVVWSQDGGSPNPGVHLEKFDKQKNTIVPATLVTSDVDQHPRVASLPTGETMVVWPPNFGSAAIAGRVYDENGIAVGPEFEVSPTGYRAKISAGGSTFVVVWQGDDQVEGRLFDTSGTAVSSVFSTTSTTSYLPDVAADAQGNFVVVWKESGYEWRAQRWQLEAPTASDTPLLGKVMVLTNKIPDDFEKSIGKWKASGDIVVPLRGSADDPRCNGDPAGTVKASVRFVSAASGQDTGAIPLPCENWTATGSAKISGVPKRGYKYSDGKREAGPCNSVKITGTKSISVSCKGKKGVAAFPYDLMVGTSQGDVVGSLTLGLQTYCAEFAPFFDGSDGKKFKGKSVVTPASCP